MTLRDRTLKELEKEVSQALKIELLNKKNNIDYNRLQIIFGFADFLIQPQQC